MILMKDQTVSLTPGVTSLDTNFEVDVGTQIGTFDITIDIFDDDTFSNLVGPNFTVNVPDMIFVGISLIPTVSNMILQGKSCWASTRFV